jgi:hypothetical protein
MMNTQRLQTVTIAVVLQALLSVGGIIFGISALLSGADAEGPPMFILVTTLTIGVLGLVSAWGVWQGKRWGMISTIVLRLLDSLGAAPAIVFAPTTALMMSAIVGIALSVVVIVLLLLPASRRAFA